MHEISIQGLGGQGVITAAGILAQAGWLEGLWPQAMPSFGPERTGSPVSASIRLAESRIITREPISRPDWLIITADKLLAAPIIRQTRIGLIVNSTQSADSLRAEYALPAKLAIWPVDASAIAAGIGNPLSANAVLLGYFSTKGGLISAKSLDKAIIAGLADLGPDLINLNRLAAKAGSRLGKNL